MNNSKNLDTYAQAVKKLTNRAKRSLVKAEKIALESGNKEVLPVHLLRAISEETGSLGKNIVADMGIDLKESSRIQSAEKRKKFSPAADVSISEDLKNVFAAAYAAAKNNSFPYVGTEHLVFAILESKDPAIKKIIAQIPARNIRATETGGLLELSEILKSAIDPDQFSSFSKIINLAETRLKKRQKKSSATPFVEKFCDNISADAEKNEIAVIGREKEIERILNILARKDKNNPLLIGDPGVGKTVLVSGLARIINSGKISPALYGKKIMRLDIARLIAGTGFRGEFETRLKEIIREVSENKNIILFIDEIHNIVGAGNISGSLDLANIIKPSLARGEIRVIGATTFSEFKKYIEKDSALERRFQPVSVSEPSREETAKILFGIKNLYESFHNVSISEDAIRLAVKLSARYIQKRFFPDKAIDVIDEASAGVRAHCGSPAYLDLLREIEKEKKKLEEEKEKLVAEENFEKAIGIRAQEEELADKLKSLRIRQAEEEKKNRVEISSADIIGAVSKISGIPQEKLSEEASRKAINIGKILSATVVGQEEAVEKISQRLLRSQMGISNPERPLGSFLFLGPTGVGKTLMAKTIASEFFGSPSSLIRIDMSELMERHSVSSLIGSPAGYIGYGEGGNLTEKVRRNPYSVVLFDEIEKAHPDVFNIFLQILEDGTLTDTEGMKVDFKNTVVIMTSNIGTEEFTKASGLGFETEKKKKAAQLTKEKFEIIKSNALSELEKKLRPELLNRLDEILVFNPLFANSLSKIAALELKKLAGRIKQKGIVITFGKNTAEFIAEKSADPAQGARLVRKNIQDLVENKIAEMIMKDKIKNGKIKVEVKKGEIRLI